MNKELYINGLLVDIDETDTPITLTFAVNDLANLEDRQSTFSSTINLPKTARNNAILGYANTDSFTQDDPYKLLPAKLVQNGIEIVPNGLFTLLRVTNNFEGQVISGIGGLGTAIADKKLVDLDMSNLDHVYTGANILASQSNIAGYIYPVIDYGLLSVSTATVNTFDLFPAVFTKTLIDKIITQAGYTYSGSVFNDPVFQNEIIPFTNDKFTKNVNNIDVPYAHGDTINMALTMPDIKQKDLLKDWMQRYCLTPVVDNYSNTIAFRSFADLYKNKSYAIDWTDKFINSDRQDEFAIGSYAQVNFANYKQDDRVTALYGNGSFSVANANLEGQTTIFSSVFAATLTVTKVGGLDMAGLNKFDPTDSNINNKTEPRVLISQNVANTTGINFFTGGSVTPNIINVAYFKKAGYPGMGYDDLLTRNYQPLFKMLTKARKITRYAMLNEVDLQQLDHFIPIYDERESQYYYLNKVVDYMQGQPTKVELIRI